MFMKTNKFSLITLMMTALIALSSCNRLSSEAKKMVGDYYIPEVSEDTPLMELNSNGKCVVRAIKPGVLTYSVEGRWNVIDDSLKIKLDPATLETIGDSTLVGNIPQTIEKAVVNYNGLTLTVNLNGINYYYVRRVK